VTDVKSYSTLFIPSSGPDGADGVFISGCHVGDCHYISGNENAYLRMDHLKNLLKMIGIDEERIEIHQISASEGKKFSESIIAFTEKIKKLGESKIPKKSKKSGKIKAEAN